MQSVLETVVIFLFLTLLTLLVALVLSIGLLLVGWVLSRLFPLSLFEAAMIALLPSIVALYVMWRAWTSIDEEEREGIDLEQELLPTSPTQRPRRPRR